MGSIFKPRYIQNRDIMNSVIKRFVCTKEPNTLFKIDFRHLSFQSHQVTLAVVKKLLNAKDSGLIKLLALLIHTGFEIRGLFQI